MISAWLLLIIVILIYIASERYKGKVVYVIFLVSIVAMIPLNIYSGYWIAKNIKNPQITIKYGIPVETTFWTCRVLYEGEWRSCLSYLRFKENN